MRICHLTATEILIRSTVALMLVLQTTAPIVHAGIAASADIFRLVQHFYPAIVTLA